MAPAACAAPFFLPVSYAPVCLCLPFSCVWPPTVTPRRPRQQVVYFGKGRPRLQTPPYWPQVMVAIPHPLFRTPINKNNNTHRPHTHIAATLPHTATPHHTPHSTAAHSIHHIGSPTARTAFHRRYVFPPPSPSPHLLCSAAFRPPVRSHHTAAQRVQRPPPAPRSAPSLRGGGGAVAGRSAPPPPHLAACPGPFPLLVCFG